MGEREESIVREFIKEWECEGSWDDAQIDRILSRMAPDARWHVYAWKRPMTGWDEIRAEMRRQVSVFANYWAEIKTIVSTDRTVLLERIDSQTMGQKKQTAVTLHAAAAVEVDADGKIAAWRDYFDSKEVEAQFGAGTSTPGSRA
jgi:limonene-1,2-epoxide hydrolase